MILSCLVVSLPSFTIPVKKKIITVYQLLVHSVCNTHYAIAFPWQKWLRECTLVRTLFPLILHKERRRTLRFSTQRNHTFGMILTAQNHYFCMQHSPYVLCNESKLCSLWHVNWNFVCNALFLTLTGLIVLHFSWTTDENTEISVTRHRHLRLKRIILCQLRCILAYSLSEEA